MLNKLKEKILHTLRWSEKYTKTDMVYLTTNTFWLTSGQGISSVISLISGIAFANLLPQAEYGFYKYVLSIAGILAISTLTGLNTAYTKAVAQGKEGDLKKILKTKINWGLWGGLAGLLIAAYYALNGNFILTLAFLMVTVSVPFLNSYALYGSILNGKKLFKTSVFYSTLSNLLITLVIIVVLFLTDNFLVVLAFFLITTTLVRVLFYTITINKNRPNSKTDPEVLTYGKHLSFMNVIGTVAEHLDSVLLWHFLGPTSVAIYAFAQAPLTPLKTLVKSIVNLAFPKFANLDNEQIKKTLPAKIIKAMLITLPPLAVIILILPLAFRLFFPQYLESIPYAQILVLTLIFSPDKLIGIALTAQAKKKSLYILNLVNSSARILFLLILLPRYGIWGAVVAILIQHVLSFGLSFYLIKK